MARPVLRLFGTFQLEVEAGKPVSLPTKKTKALLAYLAFQNNRPHERAKLAALLWADSAETQARESLRHTLSALRRALPGIDTHALVTHGDTVTLKVEWVKGAVQVVMDGKVIGETLRPIPPGWFQEFPGLPVEKQVVAL